MRLQNRVAIVTGGGKGIGRTYSMRLAQEGARVCVADIDQSAAEQTSAEIRDLGGEALPIHLDVGNPESIEEMTRLAMKRFGRIDVLVNNAALYSVLDRISFTEITTDEWDRVMTINVRGVFQCSQAVYLHMKAQGKGKIINISSGAVFPASSNMAHYVTSKMAVIGLTRALAREMGKDNICVNAITPGPTASGVNERISPPERLSNMAAKRSIPRIQKPEDLTGTVVFLASDDRDFRAGQVLNVDGGLVFH